MNISSNVINQVTIMFLLMGIGYICYKKKMINDVAASSMSEVLLMVVTPAVIIKAFQIEFNPSLAKGLVVSVCLAVISHIAGIIIGIFSIRKKGDSKQNQVDRFASTYGNAGFMGIPLIASVLPQDGVFYASAFIAVFNIFVWTHGVSIMTGKIGKKDVLKIIKSPPIIGIVLGLIMFLLNIRLPHIIGTTVNYVADLNTPLAMLVSGVYIAKTNIFKAFTKLSIYRVGIIKLIAVPLVMTAIFTFINPDSFIKNIAIANVLSSACPTAATTLLMATKYDKGPEYASMLIASTTIFSIITIPVVMFVLENSMGRLYYFFI